MPRALIRLSLVIILAVYTLLVVAGLISPSPLRAAKLPADLTVDPGESIQAAIDAANGGDTIIINAGLYTESLTLSKPVSLTGVNSATTIIHAMAEQRVLTVTGATISNSVVISGLTFTGGEGAEPGGGMLLANSAQPLIRNSAFISNTAHAAGGGLYASGPVTLIGASFINNHTFNGLGGGGLFAEGSITISDTEFIGNSSYGGGGLMQWSDVAPVHIFRSHFERNTGAYGGGLASFGSDCTLIDTNFVSNTSRAGGGAFIGSANLLLRGGRFEGNNCSESSASCHAGSTGGGLFISSTVTITGTTFINNSTAYQGGVIDFYGGGGRLINTLFARNSAAIGAAISFESPGNTAVLHSSFANPTATGEPAIAVFQGALFLTNTIIASHTIGISNTGGVVYEDYNLFFNTVTNTISVTSGGHSFNGDPRFVDPARDDYHLLLGSAAIDHGVDAGVYTDLDGNVRPYGAGFDIGAYEYAGPPRRVFLPLVH